MLQEIRADIQELLLHSVFGNLRIFLINAEGVGSEKKYCVGGVRSKDFEKRWDGNLPDSGYGVTILGYIIRRIL